MFFSCRTVKNNTFPQAIQEIEEIWIYDYFSPGGYTTAGAYGQIIRLEKHNTPKFKLEQSDVDSLYRILQNASPYKFFHNKWPAPLIFAEVILKDGQRSMVFSTSDMISIEIIQKNYRINDENNKKWLFEFRDRIIKEHSTQLRKFDDFPKDILENMDKMGIDSCSLLNTYESDYLNVKFQNSRKDFYFTKKKIGFVTWRDGNIVSNKRRYFNGEKDSLNRGYNPNYGTLYIFDDNQKEESGGYDAAIVYNSGILVSIKDVVKILK